VKKTPNDIIALITICLLAILAFPNSRSFALSTSSTNASTYGSVQYTQQTTQFTPILKFANVYGDWLDASEIAFIASNFDAICTEFDGGYGIPRKNEMASLKAQNPNIRIYGYKLICGSYHGAEGRLDEDWPEVSQHEDWFVHDAYGNRLQDSWGAYMMNIASTGWRQHWVDYVNAEIADVPQYDGVFADIVYATPTSLSGASWPNVPQSVIDNWHSDMMGMLQYVKNRLPAGKQLIINSDEGVTWQHVTMDYLNIVDGQKIEGYCHPPWSDATSYLSDYTMTNQLSLLLAGSSNRKMMIAGSGCTTRDERIVELTYACYLLGVNGSAAWGWAQGGLYDYHLGYVSIMATDIGSPTGARYSSQNVLMRDFSGGKVLYNYGSTSRTVNLGGSYRLLNGTVVTSITLSGYSGEILFLL
jgi:hypothetical protein